MIYRFIVFLILFLWIPDVYIYHQFLRHLSGKMRALRLLHWLPSVGITLVFLLLMLSANGIIEHMNLMAIFTIVFLAFAVPKSLFFLFSLVGKLLAWVIRILPTGGRSKNLFLQRAFNLLGLVLGGVGLYIILYGALFGWRRLEVKELTFAHSDVPEAFDGYRIVQISDLHAGIIAPYPDMVQEMVETINAQSPDLIAFTGDLVGNDANELDGLENILSGLKARDGVFSVLGNHDYGTYRRWPSRQAKAENLADLKRREEAMGWHLLLNENRILHRGEDSIAVVGVENDGKPPFPALGNLPKATKGTEGMFKLLLSHDPSHWRRRVLPDTDIQLMLAGHTHAMQFRLGDFSPSAWIYPEWGGLYTEGDQNLYVNTGIGCAMIPYRFGAWPEISVITLRKKR